MKIIEILLPQGITDNSLSPQQAQQIDALQRRMSLYTDKICDPATSSKGREFLKAKLRDDYHELKDTINHIHAIAENTEPVQYEVYDRTTKQKVKGGPYNSRVAARRAVDRLDNAYGAYRYGYRVIGSSTISEAIRALPVADKDFDEIKDLMLKPIPAAVAPIYIQEFIDDDEFNDQLNELGETKPGMDIRPLIVEWFRRVMPDQMYRFTDDVQTRQQKEGQMSVLHGYDPGQYTGINPPITGDAYGSR